MLLYNQKMREEPESNNLTRGVKKMIIYNNIKYAESEEELINSLFNDGEGTLTPLNKIQVRKNDVKFFIDNDHGFGINKFGIAFKFCKCSDNKTRYFLTLDEDKESFKQAFFRYFN